MLYCILMAYLLNDIQVFSKASRRLGGITTEANKNIITAV